MDTSPIQDLFVMERSPEMEFTTYPESHQALPGFQQDFFRSLLPEVERRRFLADCPRNVDWNYIPPLVNTINLDQSANRYNSQLSDIQFRLSGITRPLESFLHRILQTGSVPRCPRIRHGGTYLIGGFRIPHYPAANRQHVSWRWDPGPSA